MTASLLLRVGLILVLGLELTSFIIMADENYNLPDLIKINRQEYWKQVRKDGILEPEGRNSLRLRSHYQELVHSKRSYISEEMWREVKKSETCVNWILNKICSDSPPEWLELEEDLTGSPLKRACKMKVIELASEQCNDETEDSCDEFKGKQFRSFDGKCNNLDHPDWGRALTKFRRLQRPDYADGVSQPRVKCNGSDLPNPRLVSRHVHGSNENRTNPESAKNTLLTMSMGQFLDHDITLALAQGINCEPPTENPECVNIDILDHDKIFRDRNIDFIELERDAPFKPHNPCSLCPREHVNSITAYIDGSQIYGSNVEQSHKLRGGGGTLKDMEHPHGYPMKRLLPALVGKDDFCVSKDPIRPCFMAGDERVNENQALTSIHTLFVREHNRIANFFIRNTACAWESEIIFQRTRKIVVAFLQFIIFNEWLPEVLGRKTRENFNLILKEGKEYFTGYNKSVNAAISAAFATAAFRFGHSLVPEEFPRYSQEGFEDHVKDGCKGQFKSIPVKDFGNPFYVYEKFEGGIDAIWRGLVKKPAAEPDGGYLCRGRAGTTRNAKDILQIRQADKMLERVFFINVMLFGVDSLGEWICVFLKRKFSSSVQENLSRGEGDTSDLISINIQRSRERGVQSYLTFRNSGLFNIQPIITSFVDFEEKAGFSKSVRESLEKLYTDPKDVDLFPGLVSEGKDFSLKGGLFGPTFQALVAEQFRRLRIGDRFWFENEPKKDHHTLKTAFTPCQLLEIRKASFAKIICDNSDGITAMSKRVFQLNPGDRVPCEDLPTVDLSVFSDNYVCESDH